MRLIPCLILAVSLGACSLEAGDVAGRKATVAKRAPDAAPTQAAGSAAPPSAAQGVVSKLLRPKGPVSILKGVLSLDASYLLSVGGGTVISDKGMGAAGIAIGAGTAISDNGAGLVTAADGTVLASGEGNLISNNGGTLISNHGGSLTGKVKYRLRAADAAASLPIGTELPAAGMPLHALSLIDGSPLPLGLDSDGKPVYEIYTNATGAFEVYLDPATPGRNVRLVAEPAGGADDRLVYERVESIAGDGDVSIAEDTRLLSRYIRPVLGARLRAGLWGAEMAGIDHVADFPPDLEEQATAITNDLQAAARASSLATASEDLQRRTGQRAADAVIAFMDMDSLLMGDNQTRVLDVLTHTMRAMTAATADQLREDPDFFSKQPVIQRLAAKYGERSVRKPSDLGELLLSDALLGSAEDRNSAPGEVLATIKLDETTRHDMEDALGRFGTVFVYELLIEEQATSAAKAILSHPE